MKMKAAVLTACGLPRPFAKSKPIHVLELDLDPPGEGEVLVKVGGGGLCGNRGRHPLIHGGTAAKQGVEHVVGHAVALLHHRPE